ncbi:MAG: YbaB/EbfC family nucleoid-associated protein [Lentisphaeria bacterium]|nr:YbaB/EbfC family nucleoid-associated protein [Lentisphaeria bacterium]MBR7128560.1 YbaB/EbfC family nucleoid-associated protein [Lentisphaeria bacterium]
MFGNLGDLAKLMQQAKDIKKNMAKMREELAVARYSAIDANNLVRVTVSGEFTVTEVELLSNNLDGDARMLTKVIQEATNNALYAARNAAAEKMKELTGGVDLGGLL